MNYPKTNWKNKGGQAVVSFGLFNYRLTSHYVSNTPSCSHHSDSFVTDKYFLMLIVLQRKVANISMGVTVQVTALNHQKGELTFNNPDIAVNGPSIKSAAGLEYRGKEDLNTNTILRQHTERDTFPPDSYVLLNP